MPLPNLTPANQCTAKCKRTGSRCLRLRAWGCKTCQYHGARRPESIKRGADHPGYKHGRDSIEGKTEHRRKLYQLSELGRARPCYRIASWPTHTRAKAHKNDVADFNLTLNTHTQ